MKSAEYQEFKALEKLLIDYPNTKNRIALIEIEIEMIEHDYDTLRGQSSNHVKESTKINEMQDLSDSIVSKKARVNELKKKIDSEQLRKIVVDDAMDSLNDDDRQFITDKYFRRIGPKIMAKTIYGCSENWIYLRCKAIIQKKMRSYLLQAI